VGRYVKTSEATKQRKYTSYAHICVYMDISKALPGLVTIEYQDEDWNQTIDYEHIPFHCSKCHEHGHLFRDYPLNVQNSRAGDGKQKDGFTMVTCRKKQPPRKHNQESNQKIPISNSFDILNQLPEEEEVENPHKKNNQDKDKGKAKLQPEPTT
jgi:hypothetical protein